MNSTFEPKTKLCDCGGIITEIIREFDGNRSFPRCCPKCMDDQLRRYIRSKKQDKQNAFRRSFFDNVPQRYRKARLNQLPDKLKTILLAGSCYLWGGVGTGKTHALYSLLRHSLLKKNGSGCLTNFDNLLMEVRSTFGGHGSEASVLEPYKGSGLLCIDDIGAGADSAFAERILLSVIDYRYNRCLPTYCSSNWPPEKIKELFGERVFSRISGMCTVIKLGGQDRRLKR